jgi:hypothetical protein
VSVPVHIPKPVVVHKSVPLLVKGGGFGGLDGGYGSIGSGYSLGHEGLSFGHSFGGGYGLGGYH